MMKKGFTLIEILVASSILVMMMAAVVVITSSAYKGSRKAEAVSSVRSEGALAINSLENIIKYAKNIGSCSASSLVITTLQGETVTYGLNGSNEVASTSGTTGRVYRLTNNASARLTLCNGGAGPLFSCDLATNARRVSVCFMLQSAGAVAGDVTTTAGDGSGVQFATYITLRNWGQ